MKYITILFALTLFSGCFPYTADNDSARNHCGRAIAYERQAVQVVHYNWIYNTYDLSNGQTVDGAFVWNSPTLERDTAPDWWPASMSYPYYIMP